MLSNIRTSCARATQYASAPLQVDNILRIYSPGGGAVPA